MPSNRATADRSGRTMDHSMRTASRVTYRHVCSAGRRNVQSTRPNMNRDILHTTGRSHVNGSNHQLRADDRRGRVWRMPRMAYAFVRAASGVIIERRLP
jgi:hypothetical protein